MQKHFSRRNFLKTSGLAAGAGLVAAGCSSFAPLAGNGKKPNIVIVFSDDASPAYHSCYGGRTPTPYIDSIAKEGAQFSNAFCVTSLCCPSRHTLLSGQFPGRDPQIIEKTPQGQPYSVVQNANLTPEIPNIGRIFSQAGYHTGFLGKWHNNWKVKEAYPEFEIIKKDADPDDPKVDKTLREQQKIYSQFIKDNTGFDHVSHVVMANHVWIPRKLNTHNVEWMTQGALDFIDDAAKGDNPFLLYVADTVIHSPNTHEIINHDTRYTPGGKLDKAPDCHPPRSSVLARAKKAGLPIDRDPMAGMQFGMIMLDDQVKAIKDKLREHNLEDNTIVLFASDNSIYGKGSAYYQGAWEPLLIKWPGMIHPGTRVDQPATFVDIAPTLMAAAGIREPKGYITDGLNLLPAIIDNNKLDRDAIYTELGYTRSVIKGKYQYLAFRLPDDMLQAMQDGKHKVALDHWGRESHGFTRMNAPFKPCMFDPDQLYDLETDPFQRKNIAADPANAAILAEMKAELAEYLTRFARPFPLDIPPFMKSPEYNKLVKARLAAIAEKPHLFPGHDSEKILNYNLPAPPME